MSLTGNKDFQRKDEKYMFQLTLDIRIGFLGFIQGALLFTSVGALFSFWEFIIE
jgi:hypothetical protein